jgi:hypothetical protein
MTLSRPSATSAPNTGRDLNDIPAMRLPSDAPVGSIATCPAYLGLFIPSSDSGPVSCRALGVGNRVLPPGAGLNWFSTQLSRNSSLTQRHEPGSQALRQGTDLSPVVGRASLHVGKHGGIDGQEVGAGFQGCGNAS